MRCRPFGAVPPALRRGLACALGWAALSWAGAVDLAASSAQQPRVPGVGAPIAMAPVHVVASPAGALADENTTEQIEYDTNDLEATGALSAADFLNQLPQSFAGSGGPLILIDGRRASVGGQQLIDLNSIPPGMIERIVYSPIGSAEYGPDAVNGVINIILKKDYVGSRLSLSDRGSFAGGGDLQRVDVFSGFTTGRLTGTAYLNLSTQQPMSAAQRSFSRQEDHTARGGHNFELPWGNGREFNEAADLSLVAASTHLGGGVNLDMALGDRFDWFAGVMGSASTSRSLAPPPVANTPVDPGRFGPIRRTAHADNERVVVGVRGTLARAWHLNGAVSYAHAHSDRRYRDLDPSALSAAEAAHPAGTLDPGLYPSLMINRASETGSEFVSVDLHARGSVAKTWGGPAILSVGGEAYDRRQTISYLNPPQPSEVGRGNRRDSGALFGALSVPLFGRANARRYLRRLQLDFSGRESVQSHAGNQRSLEAGLVWQSVPWLLWRTSYTQSRSKPPPVDIQNLSTNLTLVDPRRTPATATGVETFAENGTVLATQTADVVTMGASLHPTFLPGLHLGITYAEQRRYHLINHFDAQTVVNNEAAFPSRVVRAAPSVQDRALGQPGPIVAVDITPGNFGTFRSGSLRYTLDYLLRGRRFGRFRLGFDAVHAQQPHYELAPGVPFVAAGAGAYAPPNWKFSSLATWQRGPFSASVNFRHTGRYAAFGTEIAAYDTLGLTTGYRFIHPIWGKVGRGVRILARIGNLLGEDPPYADTVRGYTGGSPLGRTYQLTLSVPL